jgi:hypothetical protein
MGGHLEGVLYYKFVLLGRISTVSLIALLRSDESVPVRIEKRIMDLKRVDASDVKLLMVSQSALHIARESH